MLIIFAVIAVLGQHFNLSVLIGCENAIKPAGNWPVVLHDLAKTSKLGTVVVASKRGFPGGQTTLVTF